MTAERTEKLFIIPGLLHEVSSPALHRLNSKLNTCPCGHQDNGQRAVELPDPRQELQTFVTGRCISRVIQVEKKNVEIAFLNRFYHSRWRACRFRNKTFVLQKKLQCVEDVRLIIGN